MVTMDLSHWVLQTQFWGMNFRILLQFHISHQRFSWKLGPLSPTVPSLALEKWLLLGQSKVNIRSWAMYSWLELPCFLSRIIYVLCSLFGTHLFHWFFKSTCLTCLRYHIWAASKCHVLFFNSPETTLYFLVRSNHQIPVKRPSKNPNRSPFSVFLPRFFPSVGWSPGVVQQLVEIAAACTCTTSRRFAGPARPSRHAEKMEGWWPGAIRSLEDLEMGRLQAKFWVFFHMVPVSFEVFGAIFSRWCHLFLGRLDFWLEVSINLIIFSLGVASWPNLAGDSAAVQDQLKDVRQICASAGAFAAILADGSVVTWGNPRHGGDSGWVSNTGDWAWLSK